MNKTIDKIIKSPAEPDMVGDGFRVYNFIPRGSINSRRMSPFLLLDFSAAHYFGPTNKPRGVDVHPHKGFETVTIAYQGSVAHNDSAGNNGIIHAGDVQWMTAGSGILHKEYHEENFSKSGGIFEVVQLWVNLPKKFKNETPHYQSITKDKINKYVLPDNDGIVNVIAGELNGIKGAAQTYSPVHLYDIKLNEGGKLFTHLPEHYNTGLLIVDGSITVNNKKADKHNFVLFNNEGSDIEIIGDEKAVILLMSGEPIDEPIARYGPFVMNTQQEILDTMKDYQDGKFGVLQ